jgi:hypothetical protein
MNTIASRSSPAAVTRVLLIAGAQRSGSTLLDRVIGSHEGFCSVGEAHVIWEGSFEQNHLCGCGVPFRECVFWGEVSRRAFGVDIDQFDRATAIRLKNTVSRIRYVPLLALSRRPRRYQSALLAYSELIERLYTAIQEVSGARVIVDSSKSPAHGLILSRLPNIEVHVVHLVRDPRAVAFSWQRQRRNPEIHWKAEDMPIDRAWRSAARWLVQNAPTELLSTSAASYVRLRYEDFLADPNAALSKILSPYDWVGDTLENSSKMEVDLQPTHTVSGNPMRFKQGQLKLKLDDEWRGAMPPRDRRLVTAATWPLLLRYGYPLWSGI